MGGQQSTHGDVATALHESGHAVAHVRLGIIQSSVTIVERGGALGCATAEGVEHVRDAAAAVKQVIAYGSGYAALMAAGHDEESAKEGADRDFAKAEGLIARFLSGDLTEWMARAVAMMREPRNVNAVTVVSDWLLREKTLDGDVIDLLVDLADGEISQVEFDRYLLLKQGR
jgi:ATP-dependent Zn protease